MLAIFLSLAKFILIFFLLGIATILFIPIILLLVLKFTGSSHHVILKAWRGFSSSPSPEPELESDTSTPDPKIIDAKWNKL